MTDFIQLAKQKRAQRRINTSSTRFASAVHGIEVCPNAQKQKSDKASSWPSNGNLYT